MATILSTSIALISLVVVVVLAEKLKCYDTGIEVILRLHRQATCRRRLNGHIYCLGEGADSNTNSDKALQSKTVQL